MRDAMTPLERVSLLLIDEPADRTIRMPILTTHAAAIAGLDPGECCRDGALLARAQLAAEERYGHDGFTVFSDVGVVAEAAGSKYRHGNGDVPSLDRPVVPGPEAIGDLALPDGESGRFPVLVEAVRALHRARGDEVPVFCLVPAPFTTAAGLRGIEDLLVDLIADPETVQRLLEFSVRATLPLLDEIVLAGGLPALVDPLASASVASPRAFREFALPATRRLVEHLHRMDLDVMLHICGETEPILDAIAETGADLFSFDRTAVSAAREAIGDRVRLVGNVAVETLLHGTKDEAAAAARVTVRDGRGNPKGFVLSTGCEIAARTPPENVRAFLDAALESGPAGGEG